ncbi:hypothetical protein TNCT_403451 [Trichonephila clavata]|uniref:Uncharacterized protein n=1 Tax=Trichonephila clavata TaxID=2740835 RepID=A0A8X6HBM6_TRICU|nr:hypothetical protein TNCT_403451 [Trichonephila clavata]
MDSRIPSAERKCIHHTTKQWFKISMNILTLTSTQVPYDRRSLRLSSASVYLGTNREKYCFTLPATVDFVFQQSSTRHSLDYKDVKPVNGPPKTFQDAMDPFRNKETAQTLIRKVLISKQALQDECPDLISRGNFRAILPRSHSLFNKAVF